MAYTLPPFHAPSMPAFVPYVTKPMEEDAVAADQKAYSLSDADYAARHPEMVAAEKSFAQQTAADQTGNTTLMPAIQNEYMQSGLSQALGAFGNSTGTLGVGSAASADVARNLGLDIMGFQQQTRDNAQKSLSLAEQLFPRRTFGMTGQDYTLLSMLNTEGYNNYNQARYANDVQAKELNYNIMSQNMAAQAQQQNANAAGQAQQTGAIAQGGAAIAGVAVLAVAL